MPGRFPSCIHINERCCQVSTDPSLQARRLFEICLLYPQVQGVADIGLVVYFELVCQLPRHGLHLSRMAGLGSPPPTSPTGLPIPTTPPGSSACPTGLAKQEAGDSLAVSQD